MKIHLYVIYLLLFSGCSDLFEFSPYDTPVKSHNLNFVNAENLKGKIKDTDTLKFVLISDTHTFYDELSDAINCINKLKGIQFVLCSGDITDAGTSREYKWYWDIIHDCSYPVFTVIGNHDHRSNGYYIFNQYFGNPNNTFTLGKYKFVLFDDIVWENGNKSPKFDWLQTALSDSNYYNVLIAHIPPWTDQLEGLYNLVFKQIVTPKNTILCLHGHNHSFEETKYSGIHTVVSGSIDKKCFNIISLVVDSAIIKHVTF